MQDTIELPAMRRAADLFGVCVMSNHVHDLIRPARPGEMPRLMPWLNWHGAMQRHRQSGCISGGDATGMVAVVLGFAVRLASECLPIGMIVQPKEGRAMTGFETKIEAEAAEFTDELSDEALDRTEGEFYGQCVMPSFAPRLAG